MNWGKIAFNLVPLLVDLVHVAEKAFDEPHSGQNKKAFVTQAGKDILKGALDATTGGAHDTWEVIDKVAPDLIDVAAKAIYPHKPKTVKPITLGHPDTGLAYDDFRINK